MIKIFKVKQIPKEKWSLFGKVWHGREEDADLGTIRAPHLVFDFSRGRSLHVIYKIASEHSATVDSIQIRLLLSCSNFLPD